MLQIRKFLVRTLSLDANELQWELDPSSTEDPLDYKFQILRNEAPEGEFDSISPEFSDRYYFIDNQLPPTSTWRTLYYKIKITDKQGYSELTPPAFIGKPENLYAIEIMRIERLTFSQFAGTKLIVLPIRTFGKPCSCYDKVTKKVLRPACKECYQTGFSGGYHMAIETYGQVGTFEQQTRAMPPGGIEIEPSGTQIRLINYPLVKRGDLIIEPLNNNRWRVVTVTPTKLCGCVIHQEVKVVLLDPSDISYTINLKDWDIFQLVEPPGLARPKSTI